jgi:NTE family protein
MQRLVCLALVGLLGAACASYRPVNQPIDALSTPDDYTSGTGQNREVGDTWMVLAFSGGGTRAAAFAFGVLEELRDTEHETEGGKVRLLDEVDSISGVSGGSFPAAYFGLFGDRIFDDFDIRFLKKNVQGALIRQALIPWNAIALMTTALSRSDLASRYYDEHVFDGATFGDMSATTGPSIHINATDLTEGTRFTFGRTGFDVICSDFFGFPVSTAVAASSAVPGLLSPLTLRNYAGRCGFEVPEWFEEALETRWTDPRRYRSARTALPYLDADRKRYIHLVDGGVSDNLGLRVVMDRVRAMGDIEKMREVIEADVPDHIVVIVVNAENEPDSSIDLTSAAPGLAASMNLVSGAQIRRYNFETLQLAHAEVENWVETFSEEGYEVTGHLVEVSFDHIQDDEKRAYFKGLPTSFSLSDEQVDALRDAGRRLLRESPAFKEVLEVLR